MLNGQSQNQGSSPPKPDTVCQILQTGPYFKKDGRQTGIFLTKIRALDGRKDGRRRAKFKFLFLKKARKFDTHTECTAQICEIRHLEIAVQVQHLSPLPDCLLPHLLVQGRAHLLGAALPSPTPCGQEGTGLWILIPILHICIFCLVGPTTCLGPVQLVVLTRYLVAYYLWQTCLFFIK